MQTPTQGNGGPASVLLKRLHSNLLSPNFLTKTCPLNAALHHALNAVTMWRRVPSDLAHCFSLALTTHR